jgi:DNA (cytosine-5)-methyltransferase 1
MPSTPRLPTISLFAGGGGLDLGVAEAGFSTVVAVEWEQYACATLRDAKGLARAVGGHRYLGGATILWDDIRSLSAEEICEAGGVRPAEATLLIGGPPCVTFSVAGKRAGLSHETGQLYEDYVRILRYAQPEAFVFENVKGLLTAPDSRGTRGGAFSTILRELEHAGYALSWRVVNAADYGVPQHRYRVIILGRRGDVAIPFPEPTHADPSKIGLFGGHGVQEPWRTVRDAIGDLPPAAPAGEAPAISNHVARSYSESVIESFKATAPGKRNPRYKRDRLQWDEPAKTVRAQGKPKSDGSGQKNSSHQSIHPEEHRQITVREAARIQTFPDWYIFDKTFVNGYRVVGDAVPPALAAVMATAVRAELLDQSPTAAVAA